MPSPTCVTPQGGFPQGDAARSATKRVVETKPSSVHTPQEVFFMTRTELPLAALVANRCRELGLRRSEVAARCGYKNISKGFVGWSRS